MFEEIRDWWRSKHMKDPVRGTALVVSATDTSGEATSENYRMTCVVTAPGIPPTTVVRHGTARVSKWPMPGDSLPVTVDRSDPTRLRVEWEEVPTGREKGLAAANELAARMRGEGTPAGAMAGGSNPGHVVSRSIFTVNGRQVDANAVPALQEALSGILGGKLDPDALDASIQKLVAQGGARESEVTVVAKKGDTAGRLRALEALRAAGLVTDEEFAEKRRRILDAI